ncbi:type II toxin-antitoxin system prevent-host-death family antitoxin [Acidobacteriota bacterium]
MKRIATSIARNELSTIINQVAFGKERITLCRRGKDIVAIIPVEDLELLRTYEDRDDLAAVRKALQEPGEDTPFEEALRELNIDLPDRTEAGGKTKPKAPSKRSPNKGIQTHIAAKKRS